MIRLIAAAGIGLAGLSQQPARPPVVLLFSVNDTMVSVGTEVPLIHRVAGARPTHYRLSEQPDFADAAWIPYEDRPRWRASLRGPGAPCRGWPAGAAVRLFFQVRAALGEEVRVVDGRRLVVPLTSESNVQSATACVIPKGG